MYRSLGFLLLKFFSSDEFEPLGKEDVDLFELFC
jgi:hypothetical protein